MISKKIMLAVLAAATVTVSSAAVITSTVTGAVAPVTQNFPNTVTNGGFTITGNALAPIVGDGIDDTTYWNFNFNGAGLASFIAGGPITSAILTLTVTPRQSGVLDDRVYIGNATGGFIPAANPAFIGVQNTIPTLASLPLNATATVTANLVNFYSPAELLTLLQNGFGGSGAGIIPFVYHDDTVTSFASLALTNSVPSGVPEPSTMALMGAGLLGILAWRKKLVL